MPITMPRINEILTEQIGAFEDMPKVAQLIYDEAKYVQGPYMLNRFMRRAQRRQFLRDMMKKSKKLKKITDEAAAALLPTEG